MARSSRRIAPKNPSIGSSVLGGIQNVLQQVWLDQQFLGVDAGAVDVDRAVHALHMGPLDFETSGRSRPLRRPHAVAACIDGSGKGRP